LELNSEPLFGHNPEFGESGALNTKTRHLAGLDQHLLSGAVGRDVVAACDLCRPTAKVFGVNHLNGQAFMPPNTSERAGIRTQNQWLKRPLLCR
jgi:hypothetical protein